MKKLKTNLERENPNKPPKEDGMTDTPLQNKKRFKNIYEDRKSASAWHSITKAKSNSTKCSELQQLASIIIIFYPRHTLLHIRPQLASILDENDGSMCTVLGEK